MKKCFYFPNWDDCTKAAWFSSDLNNLMIIKDPIIIAHKGRIDNATTYKFTAFENPFLQKLCEMTKAKMYGDYVVFDDNADIDKIIDCFQQYSFFLQGKENKWDYVKEKLGL